MATSIFLILTTAVVTSVVTIGGAWLLFDRYLRPRVWSAIDDKADELGLLLKRRVNEGVREGIRDSFSDLRSKATTGATRTGLGLMEDSINLWLGGKRKK